MNVANQRQDGMVHTMQMERRNHALITGIQDVCSFHETEIILKVENTLMVITGESLHVGRLLLEDGKVEISGQIDSVSYEKTGVGLRRRWRMRRKEE